MRNSSLASGLVRSRAVALVLAIALCAASPAGGIGRPAEQTENGSVVVVYQTTATTTALGAIEHRGLQVRRRLPSARGVVVDVPAGVDAAVLAEELSAMPGVAYAEPDVPLALQWVPDDPDYWRQWAYPHIQAPEAWDVTTGTPDVVVALLDTGVDLDHPDLVDRIVPGGWDFYDDDGDVNDTYGHGTHCAGIIAAESDNATGVAGTAPRVGILPVKVFSDGGAGTASMAADGIRFAVDAGADIINMSMGGSITTTYLESAIAYARSKGVIIAAAAGNESGAPVLYPARSPGVIAVVATTAMDVRASYSNVGPEVDLAAPGSDVYSTLVDGRYGSKTGTSMATPFVSGALALLHAAEPTATPNQLVAALQATAHDLDVSGWDRRTGFGLIQVRDAMDWLATPLSWDATAPVTVSDARATYYHAATITLSATDTDGSGVADTWFSLDGAPEVAGTVVEVLSPGTHTLSYRSIDNAGNAERTVTTTFSVLEYATPTVLRVEGANRFETSVRLSQSVYPGGSVTTAVVASGEDFPDALAASSLAGAYDSPLLLTQADALPVSVLAELDRLGVRHVIVIGGVAAVSGRVSSALVASGRTVERIAGQNRYETAAAVADALHRRLGSALPDTVFIARGDTFADALALAPLASRQGIPVLLVQPRALPAVTAQSISALGAGSVIVAGGEQAVSSAVSVALNAVSGVGSVARVSGNDRYETAVAVASYGIARGWASSGYVGIGTGVSFPDALSGGVVAGAHGGVVLLTPPTTLAAPVRGFIIGQGSHDVTACIFGGGSAVSAVVQSELSAIRF